MCKRSPGIGVRVALAVLVATSSAATAFAQGTPGSGHSVPVPTAAVGGTASGMPVTTAVPVATPGATAGTAAASAPRTATASSSTSTGGSATPGETAAATPAATTAGPRPGPPPAVPPPPPGPGEEGYGVRLRDLERRVGELKEQIFRSKARLNLLKETVLHGVIAGSRALITHRNDMGGQFTLIQAIYALDGTQIYAKLDDSGRLDGQKEFEVFNGSIVPGSHTLTAILIYRGNGYGVFSYLKGYRFTVKASHTFAVGEGKFAQIKVVAREKGNFTTPLKDRPTVDFKVSSSTERPSQAGK